MKPPPGSALWLLRHELRLAWRGTRGKSFGVFAALAGVLWLIYHVAAWALLRVQGTSTLAPGTFVMVGAAVWFAFTLMLSRAITRSVDVFFERGDLDLLLASPLAPRTVLVVRSLGVALAVLWVYAWLLTPFAHAGVVTGDVHLLAIYPALVALALLATALGIAATAALVRVLGARRTRTAAQVLGAFVGGAVFLVVQLANMVSPERSVRWREALRRAAADGGPLDHTSAVWLPLDALLGRPLALLALAATAIAAFALVVASLGREFLAGTQQSGEAAGRRTKAPAPVRFRRGLWRIVLRKEWRLIARDPRLIANTLLQSIYMVPLIVLWLRDQPRQAALAPAMVLLCATLASGLAWLTVAAEDVPELLASAPVERGLLHRAKLLAALLPVWAIALPLALLFARSDVAAAATFAACVVGATVSTASLQLALPRRGRRGDLRRRGKGHLLAGLLDLVTTLAWSATTWLLFTAPAFAAAPGVVAVATPAAAWWLGRAARRAAADAA